MGNTFGHLFRVSTFGESHGGAVGVVIDGCPSGYAIDLVRIQNFLDRRRPGQSALSSPRQEPDQVECLAGLEAGVSLGTPLCLMVKNVDAKTEHYDDLQRVYRPSHGDYTTEQKYGLRAKSGGGRSSARETIGRVAAAAVAEQILEHLCPGLRVVAFVDSVKGIKAEIPSPETLTRHEVDADALRCPDPTAREKMRKLILEAKAGGDSVGGTITCLVHQPPVGLGEPVFDKLQADLAKGMMSLPASRGFEIGLGFAATELLGSEHNDPFIIRDGRVRTRSNRSGGIQGGISNGEMISMRVAFKPVATIFKEQDTVNAAGQMVKMKPKAGRHDPCVLPRAVPMVEAMALVVLLDHLLRQLACKTAQNSAVPPALGKDCRLRFPSQDDV